MSGVKKLIQKENKGQAQVTNKELADKGRGPQAGNTSGGQNKAKK